MPSLPEVPFWSLCPSPHAPPPCCPLPLFSPHPHCAPHSPRHSSPGPLRPLRPPGVPGAHEGNPGRCSQPRARAQPPGFPQAACPAQRPARTVARATAGAGAGTRGRPRSRSLLRHLLGEPHSGLSRFPRPAPTAHCGGRGFPDPAGGGEDGRGSAHAPQARLPFLPAPAREGKALAREAGNPYAGAASDRSPVASPGRLGNARREGWEHTELPSHAPSRSRGFPAAGAHARARDSQGRGRGQKGLLYQKEQTCHRLQV